jgi:prophage regulatory protein
MEDSFLRWPDVQAYTKLSRSTIWRLENAGQFPSRRVIGSKSVAWRKSEVDAWIQSRVPASTLLGRSK